MPAISFLPFLQTVPLATRLLTLTLVLTTIAAFVLDAYVRQDSSDESVLGLNIPWLVLVPGVSWKYPWVLLTSGFVELSIVEVSRVIQV
jgi:hypothetical protein